MYKIACLCMFTFFMALPVHARGNTLQEQLDSVKTRIEEEKVINTELRARLATRETQVTELKLRLKDLEDQIAALKQEHNIR